MQYPSQTISKQSKIQTWEKQLHQTDAEEQSKQARVGRRPGMDARRKTREIQTSKRTNWNSEAFRFFRLDAAELESRTIEDVGNAYEVQMRWKCQNMSAKA